MADAGATPVQAVTPSGVNLQVVSPSASVSRPLVFPGLPASTTIRQLKEKIRDAVASRPSDDQQRLIHRGRLLARDDETLESILGAEAVSWTSFPCSSAVLTDVCRVGSIWRAADTPSRIAGCNRPSSRRKPGGTPSRPKSCAGDSTTNPASTTTTAASTHTSSSPSTAPTRPCCSRISSRRSSAYSSDCTDAALYRHAAYAVPVQWSFPSTGRCRSDGPRTTC
jgi:hypothetical protein